MDMIDNVWKNEEVVLVDNAVEITLPVRLFLLSPEAEMMTSEMQLALLIIGSAGMVALPRLKDHC